MVAWELFIFSNKSAALRISLVVSILTKQDCKAFFLTKYFIGSQLAKLRPEWSHLRDNSGLSTLAPTTVYAYCLKVITSVEH